MSKPSVSDNSDLHIAPNTMGKGIGISPHQADLSPVPEDDSVRYTNVCIKCGRKLTNRTSVVIGMGHSCARGNKMESEQRKLEAKGQQVLFPSGNDVVLVRGVQDEAICNIPIIEHYHSDRSISWGHEKHGALDLALNVLMHFGLERKEAWRLHLPFCHDFIRVIPRHGGTIPGAAIRQWIVNTQEEVKCQNQHTKKNPQGRSRAKRK